MNFLMKLISPEVMLISLPQINNSVDTLTTDVVAHTKIKKHQRMKVVDNSYVLLAETIFLEKDF